MDVSSPFKSMCWIWTNPESVYWMSLFSPHILRELSLLLHTYMQAAVSVVTARQFEMSDSVAAKSLDICTTLVDLKRFSLQI